jgi:hypothetical protein
MDNLHQLMQGIRLSHKIGKTVFVIHLQHIEKIPVENQFHFAAFEGTLHKMIQKIDELAIGGEILQEIQTPIREDPPLSQMKVTDDHFNFF